MENIELQDIENLFFDLLRKIKKEEEINNEQISKLYKSENWNELKCQIEKYEQLIKFKSTLYNFFESANTNIDRHLFSNEKLSNKEKISIEEFYDEKEMKNKIRIKTEKSEQTYSNIVTIDLFESIIDKTLSYLQINKYVKTNQIARELKDTIKEESGYSKASTLRVPIYAVYKYLLYEGILEYAKDNKHKYIFKNMEGKERLKSLKNKIRDKENLNRKTEHIKGTR